MKRAWRIIPFALLAAAALVLAAGCSDDPTGDLGGQAAGESAGSAGAQDAGASESGQAAGASGQAAGTESAGSAGESAGSAGAQDAGVSESGQGTGTESAASTGSASGQGTGGSQAITQNDILDLIKEIDYVNGHNGYPHPLTYWDFSNATLGEDSVGIVAVIPWSVQPAYEGRLSYKPYIKYTLKQLKARGKVGTSLLSVDLSGAEWDESTGERTQAEKTSSGYRYVTLEIALAEGASGELTEELQSVAIALDSGECEWGID